MRPRLFSIAIVCLVVACDAGREDALSSLPWRTDIDASGDTIVARVTGDVPDSLVRSLVPDLQVGALEGAEELTFGSIGDVIGTANGGLLVHDDDAGVIRFYDSTGAFIKPLGRKGGGPGEYGQVNGIARAPNGDLYVWDASGSRINRYRADGEYVGMFRSALSSWFTSNRLYADSRGRIGHWLPIMKDQSGSMERDDAIVLMDTVGTVLDTVLYPRWAGEPELLQASSRDGGSRTATTRPFAPEGVATFHVDGGIVTGFNARYEFFKLPAGAGKVLRVERSTAPVAVSATERSEQQTRIEMNMRRLDPGWNWTGAPIPDVKPAYRSFLVGEDGRIWVRLHSAGEPIPSAEIPTPQPSASGRPPLPPLTTRERTVYDVFSPEGRLLGRVALPWGATVYRTRGDWAWGWRRDADDVEYAVRFRIEPSLQP
jgi:hypothetical protein